MAVMISQFKDFFLVSHIIQKCPIRPTMPQGAVLKSCTCAGWPLVQSTRRVCRALLLATAAVCSSPGSKLAKCVLAADIGAETLRGRERRRCGGAASPPAVLRGPTCLVLCCFVNHQQPRDREAPRGMQLCKVTRRRRRYPL